MAAVHSTTTSSSSALLSRTRSTRVPAKLDPASSAAGTAATTGNSSAAIPTSTSNVSLFLTNLRLLDLDLFPDWPGINTQTFSAKDAAQGQKKRIQSVEWALYQLFVLWDADDARNKLQPFFPPLDQVQSLNLRAALLRSLEQVKKSGLLGRDAVVRKTMLDECRGERLEEVLAVFSSAVLKKLVTEQQLNDPGRHPAISQRIALENRGYSAERTELNALVLAHKGSLTRLLREKKAAHARYEDFAELLALKGRSVARRREQVKTLKGETCAEKDGREDDVRLEIWRTVRNNWSGNEKWMETLLYGDANARKDGLLSSPYDRVWRRVQSGRLAELEDQSGGLLEQLDNRIRAQKERLAKWENFHKSLFGQTQDHTTQKSAQPLSRQRGLDLGFGAHETLYPGRMSPRKQLGHKPTTLGPEYSELIDSLKAELANIDIGDARPFLVAHRPEKAKRQRSPQRLSVDDPATEEVISELSDLEDEPVADSRLEKPRNDVPKPVPVKKISTRESQQSSHTAASSTTDRKPRPHLPQNFSASSRVSTPSPVRSPIHSPIHSPTRSPTRSLTRSPTRSPTRAAVSKPVDEPAVEEPMSPTQQLADQIIASMSAASPSPVKGSKPRHTLSLAERTRLSMARGSRTSSFEEDEPDLDTSSFGLNKSQRSQSPEKRGPPGGSGLEDVAEGEVEDLVARTRRSMVNFEATRQKAQLERRRSQRKSRQQPSRGGEGGRASYFPPVEEGDTTLLAEEMMAAGQDDYEAVFMSRPKIKTSPVTTPIKGWD